MFIPRKDFEELKEENKFLTDRNKSLQNELSFVKTLHSEYARSHDEAWLSGYNSAAEHFVSENISLRKQLESALQDVKNLEKEINECKLCVKKKGHPHVDD